MGRWERRYNHDTWVKIQPRHLSENCLELHEFHESLRKSVLGGRLSVDGHADNVVRFFLHPTGHLHPHPTDVRPSGGRQPSPQTSRRQFVSDPSEAQFVGDFSTVSEFYKALHHLYYKVRVHSRNNAQPRTGQRLRCVQGHTVPHDREARARGVTMWK